MRDSGRRLAILLWLLWPGAGMCEADVEAEPGTEQHTEQGLEQALRTERLKVGELQVALTELRRQRASDNVTELQRQVVTLERDKARLERALHEQQSADGTAPGGLFLALMLGFLLGLLAMAGYQYMNPLFGSRRMSAAIVRRRTHPVRGSGR